MTKEEIKEYIESVEEHCKAHGLETLARELQNKQYEFKDEDLMQFNLPDSKQKYMDGNGEGVWGVPLTPEGKRMYENDSSFKETFKAVLLNDSIYHPFPYGTVITVETRGDSRPVMSWEWYEEIAKTFA